MPSANQVFRKTLQTLRVRLGLLTFWVFSLWLSSLFMVVTAALGAQVPVLVGAPTHLGAANDTLAVPFHLTNLSASEITQVDFTVGYDGAAVSLAGLRSAVDADFSSTFGEEIAPGSRRIGFKAKAAGLPYGPVHLGDLLFVAKSGATFPVTVNFTQGTVQGDANQTLAASSLNLQTGSGFLRTDINRDGRVDLEDAASAFQFILTTGREKRIPAAYDFSGKLMTGAYDVALLQRHILGYVPTLASPSQDTVTPQRTNVALNLSATPTSLGGGYYRYTLSGTAVQGLLAGEFTLGLNTAVFQSVSLAQSGVGEVRTAVGHSDRSLTQDQLYLYLVGLEPLANTSETLVQLTVKHKTTTTTSAFTGLKFAYLNEGALRGNFPTRAAGDSTENATVILANPRRNPPQERQDLRFMNPAQSTPRFEVRRSGHDLQIIPIDAQGRRLR